MQYFVLSVEAEADNANRGLKNFSYPMRTEYNNCFIIYFYLYRTQGKRLHCKKDLSFKEAIWQKPHKLEWRHKVV